MRTFVAFVALLALVAVVIAAMYVTAETPDHSNVGSWSETLPVLAATVVAAVVVMVGLLGGAWRLWQAKYERAAQLLAVTALLGGMLVWVLGDALNVLLDDSPPERHETTVTESVGARAKQRAYVVVDSWRTPGEALSIDLQTSGQSFAAGTRVVVTTRAGAFGRPYAIALEPAAP